MVASKNPRDRRLPPSQSALDIAMNPAEAKTSATAIKYGPVPLGGSVPRTPRPGMEKGPSQGVLDRNPPLAKKRVRPDQIKRFMT
jgi:hypothetical protein